MRPLRLGECHEFLAVLAALVASLRRELRQNAFGHGLGITDNTDGNALGEADAVGIDIDLNDLGLLWPIIEAIAGKRREWIEPGAQGQHNVRLADQFHPCLRAIVPQRTGEQRVRTGERIIVLIADADRRIEALGQLLRGRNGAADDDARAIEDHREFRFGEKLGGSGNGVIAAGGALELDDGRKFNVDHLREVIARHVDLCWG